MSVQLEILKAQQKKSLTGHSMAYGIPTQKKQPAPKSREIPSEEIVVPIADKDRIHQQMRAKFGLPNASKQVRAVISDSVVLTINKSH